MASSNPFIVPDLVHKYGWDFLGYMANLGVNLPGNGQVFFVDSNATEASDVDDANHGHLMHSLWRLWIMRLGCVRTVRGM